VPRRKPSVEENAGRLVRKAADVLQDRTWVQGEYGDADKGMCAVTSIFFTATGRSENAVKYETHPSLVKQTIRTFGNWLEAAGFTSWGSVPAWNDAPGRTKDEVLQIMRKFADEVDPQRLT
jgi:hypothetical protein